MFFVVLYVTAVLKICNTLLPFRMTSYPHLRRIPRALHSSWSFRVKTPTALLLLYLVLKEASGHFGPRVEICLYLQMFTLQYQNRQINYTIFSVLICTRY